MVNHNEKGFTLIEIIVSLILVAIIAAVVSMGFLQVVNGYIFSKTNAETLEKGQMAITRMIKELGNCTITSGTATSVTFTRRSDGILAQPHQLKWTNGTTILIFDNNILTDRVNSFALSYLDKVGIPGVTAVNAKQVQIILKLTAADNTVETFTNRIYVGSL